MPAHEFVTTVDRVQSVVARKGLVVRFAGTDGRQHYIQFPTTEAGSLADIVAIAIQMFPDQRPDLTN